MPRILIGLFAALGTGVSACVGLVHGRLVPLVVLGSSTASWLATTWALPGKKPSRVWVFMSSIVAFLRNALLSEWLEYRSSPLWLADRFTDWWDYTPWGKCGHSMSSSPPSQEGRYARLLPYAIGGNPYQPPICADCADGYCRHIAKARRRGFRVGNSSPFGFFPYRYDPRAWSGQRPEGPRISGRMARDRAGQSANADANNGYGPAWTALEPATARTTAEQAPGTGVDNWL